jgi:two-component system LytT family sensor kinase
VASLVRRQSQWWGIILAGWGVYALYMAVTAYVVSARLGHPITIWHALSGEFSYATIWLLFTPLVLWLARRWPFERGKWVRRLLLHLSASILLAIIHKGVHGLAFSLFRTLVDGEPFSWELQYRQVLSYFDYGVQLYWLILLLASAHQYYLRYQASEVRAVELERQLAETRLEALRRQVHPHFLFNTLHTIAGLVRSSHSQQAVGMIAGLSDLLRASLEVSDRQETPLREEVELLRRYLAIEKVRFSDRLQTEFDIEPAALDVPVPTLVLQPLVENAVRHGLSTLPGDGLIVVRAHRGNGKLLIEISDNGHGLAASPGAQGKENIGLGNTRARLQALYGDHQSLELVEREGGGVTVRLTIPWQQEASDPGWKGERS